METVKMARRPRQKTPNRRYFTLYQIRRMLKAHLLELAAIGGAYHLEKGEIRRRVLGSMATVQELIDRFPP
jgi:hypothetical protein